MKVIQFIFNILLESSLQEIEKTVGKPNLTRIFLFDLKDFFHCLITRLKLILKCLSLEILILNLVPGVVDFENLKEYKVWVGILLYLDSNSYYASLNL